MLFCRSYHRNNRQQSRKCIYEVGENQDKKYEQVDHNMNIEYKEQHQEDNMYSLADTTNSSNYNSSEDEEEFIEDITIVLNGVSASGAPFAVLEY